MAGLARHPRRSYYDLLGVDTEATEQDLKQAYKKQALLLHPDKQGGDGEPFKKMKQAYDVLLDPNKRTAYDKYGEAGVKFAEGNMSPDVAMEVFMNIDMSQRMTLVLGITCFTGFLLLLPILICVKWDHPDALSFVQVFAPVWILSSTVCCFCCCFVRAPTINEEDDEETRKGVEEVQAQTQKLRAGSYAVVGLCTTLFAFLTCQLDGTITWSFFCVIWPWMLLEFSNLLWYLHAADRLFLLAGGDPNVVKEGLPSRLPWLGFVFNLIRTKVVHLVFATLLALKMDGVRITWWLVFIPYWIDYVLAMLSSFSQCRNSKSKKQLEEMTEEERESEVTGSSIACTFLIQSVSLGCVVLCCKKAETPKSYSAFIVFLPIFISAFCFCCCLSCSVVFMRPPQEQESGFAGDGPAAGYGATNAPSQEQGTAPMAMSPPRAATTSVEP